MNRIKDVSESIAKEISERGIFNVQECSRMIETRLRNIVPVLLSDYKSEIEKKYQELKEEAARCYTRDRRRYIQIGLELSALKDKKTQVNRAMADMQRNDRYAGVKEYIIQHYGQETWETITKKINHE